MCLGSRLEFGPESLGRNPVVRYVQAMLVALWAVIMRGSFNRCNRRLLLRSGVKCTTSMI